MATIYGIEGLLAGRTLVNRYHVEEVIGRGGMGAVYRARDTHLGRSVAVKVITVAAPDRDAHQRLRDRFRREARAAAGLQHPSVVGVFDYGTDPELGLDFLVMELLEGEDLAGRLQRAGSPVLRTTLSIIEQAARGLAAGHRAGLIHRDVKPGNIFLQNGDRAGEVRVKILDFGIADLASAGEDTLTHLTVAGRSPFSPAFASPEQLRGEPRLTPATDVFSLGAVAFQLITGRRLFSSSEPQQMLVEMSAALAEERPKLRSLPHGLGAVLVRALAPEAVERHPHAGAFADAIAAVLAAGDGPARRSSERETEKEREREIISGPARPEEVIEQTRLVTDPRPGRVAAEMQALQASPNRAAPVVAQKATAESAMPAARQPGRLRRAATALLGFLITAGATGLFGAAWIAAFIGLQDGSLDLVYGGVAGSVIATPFALHRLMGRRGRLGLSIFASLAGTFGCIYWLGSTETMDLVIGAIFAAQVFLCITIEWLTGGRAAEPESTLP